MKTLNYAMSRGICAAIVGVLLVAWPEAAILYLVIAVGALFLIPGLVSVMSYLTQGRRSGMSFPLVSVGSLLFGLWLMMMPAFFVGILMYVLGAMLVFAGIHQIVTLANAGGRTPVSAAYYAVPVLVLLAGLLVLINPFAAASVPFIILGVSCVVYGVADVINLLRFRRKERQVEDAVIVEDER